MKLIRELRMGPPKSCKTGATAGTYPKPMLWFLFDKEGLSVIPPKKVVIPPELVQFNVRYEDIVFVKPGELGQWVGKESPQILAVDYTEGSTFDIQLTLKPAAGSQPFERFVADYNAVANHIRSGKTFPWTTVGLDGISGLEDLILSHVASFNPNALADARQWAGQVGGKVKQVIMSLVTWPCHVVILCHTLIDKQENTGLVVELPSVYSSFREEMSRLFSQVFYATRVNGKPVVWPHDQMFTKGVGARWPIHTVKELAPDFNSVYGKELL